MGLASPKRCICIDVLLEIQGRRAECGTQGSTVVHELCILVQDNTEAKALRSTLVIAVHFQVL